MHRRTLRLRRRNHKGRRGGTGSVDASSIAPVRETRKWMEPLTTPANQKQRLASMLNVACADSDFCIEIGAYEQQIHRLFRDFTDFSMISYPDITLIGTPSKNGAVLRIPFVANSTDFITPYIAFTVMKFAQHEYSDNLGYEGWVGEKLINPVMHRIPHFVRTYGVYRVASPTQRPEFDMESYVRRLQSRSATRSDFSSYDRIPTDKLVAPNVCTNPATIALMIQHFPNFLPISSLITGTLRDKVMLSARWQYLNIYGALFQVYFSLHLMQDHFTHYDLHAYNVGLYNPFRNPREYIEMHYHIPDPNGPGNEIELVFPCSYLAKIIDYGRAHVNLKGMNAAGGPQTTREYVDQVCAQSRCRDVCGDKKGFSVINGLSKYYLQLFINPTVRNRSADLLLLRSYQIYPAKGESNRSQFPRTSTVDIEFSNANKDNYSTPERSEVGYPFPSPASSPSPASNAKRTIYNVGDAFRFLLDMMLGTPTAPKIPAHETNNRTLQDDMRDEYSNNYVKRGVMHVYGDGRNYTFEVLDPMIGTSQMKTVREPVKSSPNLSVFSPPQRAQPRPAPLQPSQSRPIPVPVSTGRPPRHPPAPTAFLQNTNMYMSAPSPSNATLTYNDQARAQHNHESFNEDVNKSDSEHENSHTDEEETMFDMEV